MQKIGLDVNFYSLSLSSFPQGLSKDHIFTHHGTRYMHNSMSLYDQQFNRRHSVGSRKWDRHRLAWLPEASDNPLQGAAACSRPSLIPSHVIILHTVLRGERRERGIPG